MYFRVKTQSEVQVGYFYTIFYMILKIFLIVIIILSNYKLPQATTPSSWYCLSSCHYCGVDTRCQSIISLYPYIHIHIHIHINILIISLFHYNALPSSYFCSCSLSHGLPLHLKTYLLPLLQLILFFIP